MAIGDAEVAEQFGLLRPYPELWVPEDDVVVVVDHWPLFGQAFEGFLVGEGDEKAAVGSDGFGHDGAFAECGKVKACHRAGDDNEVALAVDVVMEVDLVQGIHFVDQPSPRCFAAGKFLDLEGELFLHGWLVLKDLAGKHMRVFELLDGLVVFVALVFEFSGFLDIVLDLLRHFGNLLWAFFAYPFLDGFVIHVIF